ncbi:DUF4241 domain-containing protein [Oryzobacter terrae]|uniref:DUF4241 domain-containing protein n=1 Tax=Oryzobacter terrae TaxID=1620385 RepID=UPI00366C8597
MRAGGRTTRRTSRRAVLGGAAGGLALTAAGCDPFRSPTSPASTTAGDDVHGPIDFPEGPLDPATLLPYGSRYRTEDGEVRTLERVEGPVLDARGTVALADPGFIRYEEVVPLASFTGPVRSELGLLSFPARTVDAGTVPASRRGATVAFGEVAAVDRWEAARGATGDWLGVGVDAATGALYDVSAKPALDRWEQAQWVPLFEEVIRSGFAEVRLDGRTVAVMFDCGVGDGWYPAYLGRDRSGAVSAVALDLELRHRLTRLP